MKAYERILRAVHSLPWAIQPEKLEAIIAFLELKASGQIVEPAALAEIQTASQAAADRIAAAPQKGAVAVLPLYGIISHRANMMADISGPRGTSVDKFTQAFRSALSDPNVAAIVMDIDSPGGTVAGVPELADEIYQSRGKKPITAVCNSLAASAAYWIASACDEIVVSPSAMVGSIGVYCSHGDYSKALEQEGVKVTLISAGKYKTEGNPYEPLSTDGYDDMKGMVEELYGMFTRAVAKGRGAKADDVRNGYGEGRAVTAQKAVKLGMADRVATFDQVLAKYGVSRSAGPLKAETFMGDPEGQLDDEDEQPPFKSEVPEAPAIVVTELPALAAAIEHELERSRFDLA